MVSKKWALTVVQRYLAETATKHDEQALVVTDVRSHELGWLVGSRGERHLRTGEHSDMLVGHGYFLVDGVDGSLYMLHPTSDIEHGEWIVQYLEEIRGVERVDPLRSRVAELLARGERPDALRVVRAAAPDLGPQGAKEYVEAVVAAVPVPERLNSPFPVPQVGFTKYRKLTGPNREPVA